MIRVIVVDDNVIVRRGLVSVLGAADSKIVVVGEGATGRDAISLAREHRPDLVLLDLEMPVMDGVVAAGALSEDFRVIMLTSAQDEQRVTAAIRAGACGYLVHGRFEAHELVDYVHRAARGETVLSPAITSTVFRALRRGPEGDVRGDPHELTARELEVMNLLSEGRTNREIADRLVLSEKTVKNHVNNCYRKLGVTRRAQAIAWWLGSAREDPAGRQGDSRR